MDNKQRAQWKQGKPLLFKGKRSTLKIFTNGNVELKANSDSAPRIGRLKAGRYPLADTIISCIATYWRNENEFISQWFCGNLSVIMSKTEHKRVIDYYRQSEESRIDFPYNAQSQYEAQRIGPGFMIDEQEQYPAFDCGDLNFSFANLFMMLRGIGGRNADRYIAEYFFNLEAQNQLTSTWLERIGRVGNLPERFQNGISSPRGTHPVSYCDIHIDTCSLQGAGTYQREMLLRLLEYVIRKIINETLGDANVRYVNVRRDWNDFHYRMETEGLLRSRDVALIRPTSNPDCEQRDVMGASSYITTERAGNYLVSRYLHNRSIAYRKGDMRILLGNYIARSYGEIRDIILRRPVAVIPSGEIIVFREV